MKSFALQRPAEMNFYDELGVASNASPEEVREAFRALVRILHPDHQTDPQLKDIADRQMRKLNRVYAVLSDADKRRRYDLSLEKQEIGRALILSPRCAANAADLTERVAWMGALAVVVIALVWLASDNPAVLPAVSSQQISERAPRKISVVSATPATSLAHEVARLRAELHAVGTERDLAVRELSRLRAPASRPQSAWAPAEPAGPTASPLVTAGADVPAPVLAALPVVVPDSSRSPLDRNPSQPASKIALRPFVGFWFYSKDAGPQRSRTFALYPPEFIETTITEQNGMVRGKYRSRYRIADRAISPDVVFEFAGTATGSTLVCPWTGPGGARGELTLKMAGENGLMVDWTATELGTMQGLITGTATLTRRID
jgi:hypothetical protein